jgi:hypothetical protein
LITILVAWPTCKEKYYFNSLIAILVLGPTLKLDRK